MADVRRLKKRTALTSENQLNLAFDFAAPAFSPPPFTEADSAPRDARLRRVMLGADPCEYRLRRAKRRTIGFQIDDAGLTVSAPRWVTLREIEAALLEKQRWIRAKLAEWRDWHARRKLPTVVFAEGGTLPFLGGTIALRLGREVQMTRLVDGRELLLALPGDAAEQQVRDAVQAWLQNEARRVLGERLALLAERIEVKPRTWSISSARSQWGSCTHDGRIRLSWRLVHFALPVIDYVVAHELAHLKELNHSPRFWSAVAQLLPGFEAARDEIKQQDVAALPL
ncbi:MAG TPA: SprT family zinc-dependent metalloprotease [Burkholderiaceae bacterium]|nr:SprT family zinc-dependent metalloprotease [Burkholderiaceae bacterium]